MPQSLQMRHFDRHEYSRDLNLAAEPDGGLLTESRSGTVCFSLSLPVAGPRMGEDVWLDWGTIRSYDSCG